MGLSAAALAALEGRLRRSTVLSLDAPAPDSVHDDATLASIVLHTTDSDPLERRERASYVNDALSLLPERLRAVVVGYFLDGRTSGELAEELGVTQSRISQLRTKALELMRHGIAAQYGEQVPPSISRRAVTRQSDFNGALAARSDFPSRLAGARRSDCAGRAALLAG